MIQASVNSRIGQKIQFHWVLRYLSQYLENGLPKIVTMVKMKKLSLGLHRRDELFCDK